jgi:hypothetical protein
MKGFHIYYKFKENNSEFNYIDFLGQLCSILFWKQNYGEIGLVCNKSFYEDVKFWGLDKYYDSIDISTLHEIDLGNKLEIYWSFPKIYAINKISKSFDKFCVVDTDFWFYSNPEFNEKHDVVAYHPESLKEHSESPYINVDNFSTSKQYDWSTMPVNCAFLYFNSSKLITKWYEECLYVIENTNSLDSVNSSHTVFIEQRLLTSICKDLKLKFSTLLENTYIPFAKKDGSEWSPQIGYTAENFERFNNIKHIWGLKKLYDDPSIRNMILSVCKISLDHFFPEWELYNIKLVEELYKNLDIEELEKINIV